MRMKAARDYFHYPLIYHSFILCIKHQNDEEKAHCKLKENSQIITTKSKDFLPLHRWCFWTMNCVDFHIKSELGGICAVTKCDCIFIRAHGTNTTQSEEKQCRV